MKRGDEFEIDPLNEIDDYRRAIRGLLAQISERNRLLDLQTVKNEELEQRLSENDKVIKELKIFIELIKKDMAEKNLEVLLANHPIKISSFIIARAMPYGTRRYELYDLTKRGGKILARDGCKTFLLKLRDYIIEKDRSKK
jgi:hypothetical protein